MVDAGRSVQLLNYSGCGNTVSGNHPVTQRMILDSLRMCAAALLSPLVEASHHDKLVGQT